MPTTTTKTQPDRASKREQVRIARRQCWIDFLNSFVPSEGAVERLSLSHQLEKISCDPAVKDALHLALISACEALEEEARRDIKLLRKQRPKEGN